MGNRRSVAGHAPGLWRGPHGGAGYIGLRIMALVFVDRPPEQPTERRIISLRKANSREVKRYAET